MEVSRITFTNETKARIKRGMSPQRKGEILYGRLCEAADNGLLAQCKTRREVAELVGYTAEQKDKGYSWISNLIRRKHISEVMVAPGEFQFFMGPKRPDYEGRGVKKAKAKIREQREPQVQQIQPVDNTFEKVEVLASNASKIVMSNPNGMTITFENVSAEIASKIIDAVIITSGVTNAKSL